MTASASAARVAIIGGGPAGLSAAIELRRRGIGEVVVHEREQTAGGIPRHTDHLGYGMRDLRRMMKGPAYARRLVELANRAGVAICTGAPVHDLEAIDADAIVLATGVRERPRSARLIPGDRPAGVFTTGAIQQLTALHHRDVGTRAVVVGAEHVSFSAILTLRHGGCDTVAMVTPLARHQTYAPLRVATATRRRVPILSGVDIAEVLGRTRVEAVRLTDGTMLHCDTVVFTGGWIPDHELARRAGIPTNAGRAPVVDLAMRTDRRGVFAAGNLIHPAETADVCALDGRRVAAAVGEYLQQRAWPAAQLPIACTAPLLWATPAAAGLTTRVGEIVTGRIVMRDASGAVLHRSRRRTLLPNRAIHLPLVAAALIAIEP
jgi:thioredoxin reductase